LLPEWHPAPATGQREDATRSLGWCGVARELGELGELAVPSDSRR